MNMSATRIVAILDETCLPPACACETCRSYCRDNPGFPTPDEAEKMLGAGLASKMMLEWWVTATDRVYVVIPASGGRGGGLAPSDVEVVRRGGRGPCVFLSPDTERCGLHDSGFKPWECRNAHHANKPRDVRGTHEAIVASWDTDYGRAVVELWREAVGCHDEPPDPEDDPDADAPTEEMPRER